MRWVPWWLVAYPYPPTYFDLPIFYSFSSVRSRTPSWCPNRGGHRDSGDTNRTRWMSNLWSWCILFAGSWGTSGKSWLWWWIFWFIGGRSCGWSSSFIFFCVWWWFGLRCVLHGCRWPDYSDPPPSSWAGCTDCPIFVSNLWQRPHSWWLTRV